MTDDAEVAWGWTFHDVQTFAHWAARRHLTHGITYDDKHLAAYDGIIDCLLERRSTRPTRAELCQAAIRAISRAVDAEGSCHGTVSAYGTRTGRRFATYWANDRLSYDPFDERLCDQLGAVQVYWSLTPRQREILLYAMYYRHSEAADLLGMDPLTYRSILSKARASARELWFFPDEAPGKLWHASKPRGENYSPRVMMKQRRRQAAVLRRRSESVAQGNDPDLSC